jgi:hypothetical protein
MRNHQKINLPEGTHDEVLKGELLPMIENWSDTTVEVDKAILTHYGLEAGQPFSQVVPALCYARISSTAWELCSVAEIMEGDFDPVEFGRRCEAIPREQIERYRGAKEAGQITDGVVLERSALFAAKRQS